MFKKMCVLMMVIVFAFAIAACGDDEEPASGGGATTEEATPEEATPEAEATEATEEATTDPGGGATDEQIQAAIESCKSSVQAQSGQLSEDVRADLEDICDEIKTGDAEEIRRLTIDVCVRVAEETVPDGTARQQVIDACEQAAP